MSTRRSLLGKIFISHSSLDKTFVRRLVKRLATKGFDTWLDEHEMVVGDPLANKIAEGVSRAKIVIVVVSPNSVESKWLKYELNLATDRMVKGECRLLPLVIGDVDPPPEVRGLLYADFRESFSDGFKSILTALLHEEGRAAATASFWLQAKMLIEKVFPVGFSFPAGGGYKDNNYDLVFVSAPAKEHGHAEVIYDQQSAHGRASNPLDEGWFAEYREAMEESHADLYLMVTERPVSFEVVKPFDDMPHVSYRVFEEWDDHVRGYAVFVDLSQIKDEDERLKALERARDLLTEFAAKLV